LALVWEQGSDKSVEALKKLDEYLENNSQMRGIGFVMEAENVWKKRGRN
jgi:hypothetical protein